MAGAMHLWRSRTGRRPHARGREAREQLRPLNTPEVPPVDEVQGPGATRVSWRRGRCTTWTPPIAVTPRLRKKVYLCTLCERPSMELLNENAHLHDSRSSRNSRELRANANAREDANVNANVIFFLANLAYIRPKLSYTSRLLNFYDSLAK